MVKLMKIIYFDMNPLLVKMLIITVMLPTATVAVAGENTTIDNATTAVVEIGGMLNVAMCLKDNTVNTPLSAMESDQANNITIINNNEWSETFYECPKVQLSGNDLCAINSSKIFVPTYGISYSNTDYYIVGNFVTVCIHFSLDEDIDNAPEAKNTNVIDKVGGYLTIIGISISNICLALHFLVFVLIAELQNLPGKNLAALTVAIFCSNLFFLIAQKMAGNDIACILLASITLFFFLSSFLWMSVIGFETWRSLRMASTKLRLCTKLMEQRRYVHYSLYAWLTPLIVIITIIILDSAGGVNAKFQPGLGRGKNSCWFTEPLPAIVFLVVPLVMVMTSNLVFFLWSAFIIYKHTDRLNQNKKFKSLIHKFSSYGKLAIVTGLTWITAIIAFAAKNIVTWYIFIIFTTFYGSIIFVSFTCTKKVLRHLVKRFPLLSRWLPTHNIYSSSSESDTHESRT